MLRLFASPALLPSTAVRSAAGGAARSTIYATSSASLRLPLRAENAAVRSCFSSSSSSFSSSSGDKTSPAPQSEASSATASSSTALAPKLSERPASVSTVIEGIPDRALAGVSEESIKELAARAAKGKTSKQVFWSNPGSQGQLSRIPDEVIMALPPPRKPLWPEHASKATWRYARAFSVTLIFVALAIYLQAKDKVKGSTRLALERRYPWLTAALVRMGVVQDYQSLQGALDRRHLFARVFDRFAAGAAVAEQTTAEKSGDTATIPLSRAITLAHSIVSPSSSSTIAAAPAAATAPEAEASSSASASASVSVSPATAKALKAVGLSSSAARLTKEQFVAFLSALCAEASLSDIVVLLSCAENLGVTAVEPAVWDALSGLFDRLLEQQAGQQQVSSLSFTAESLADLSSNIGFSGDIDRARRFVDEALLRQGRSPLPSVASSTASSPQEEKEATKSIHATFDRSLFVDFLTEAASAAQIDGSRVSDYLRVFFLLHLSGIREAAGVAGPMA